LAVLRAFESACRHLSFKKAADELHVTPAAVSQQIKLLEGYLGVALFRRLVRTLEVTPQGLAMLPKVREAFQCLAAAIETTRSGSDATLIVNAPPSFASRWLLPRLPRFSATHSELQVRLASSVNTIDRPGAASYWGESPVDPRSPVCEVAIRYGTGNYPGFQVHKIFTPDCVPVCSPGLPTPQRPLATPEDLGRHVLIHDETIGDKERLAGWETWLRAAGAEQVDAQRGPRFSNAVLSVEAALNGQGVALALRPMIDADVAAGRLMIPFDIAVPSPYAYYLVTPLALAARPAVLAFRDWLMAEGAQGRPDAPVAIAPATA
jgi:LysR family glycine cleavage system transcriptional activator